jgi:predicted amino acid dehydrogenase
MKREHIGFLINIPAKGGHGAKEALKLRNGLLGRVIREDTAEQFAIGLKPSQCYFGPSPVITCSDGVEIVVHILGVPATSAALLDQKHPLHHLAIDRLLAAPEELRKLAKTSLSVLGLGAATAIVAGHGRSVFQQARSLPDPYLVVTSGNTVTSGLSVEIAKKVVEQARISYPFSIGVLGGFGSTGSRVVTMAAEAFKPQRIVITTGTSEQDHSKELSRYRECHPHTEFVVGDLCQAVGCRLSFLATSSVSALAINPNWVARNAIMIDIGKPLNTELSLALARPDVTIVDGSLALLPEGTNWNDLCRQMSLVANTVFGCLAETIFLGHEEAVGKLLDFHGKTTFIGRPDGELARSMVDGLKKIGLNPHVVPAHRPH